MKQRDGGFTLLELAIVIALSATIALSTTVFTFHAFNTTARIDEHLTAVANIDNAGYWISRDALMADTVLTNNLTSPTFLILKWTEWGYDEDNVYYSATYSIENISGGIGQLKRRLESSAGLDKQLLIASDIYYNTADPTNSTNVTYQSPTVNLKVATRSGSVSEVRDYQIYRRPNF